MKKVFLSIVFLSLLKLNAQVPDSIKRSVDSVLLILQQKSLYAKKVNWEKVRKTTYSLLKNPQNIEDTYEALTYAFSQLKDYHGQIRVGKNQTFSLKNPAKERQDTNMLKELFSKPPRIVIAKLGEFGYIRVPHMNPLAEDEINKLASRVSDSICKLNKGVVKGWIVDLRVNVGGNFKPMIGGLASLFCNGTLGYFVNNSDKIDDSWQIKNGQMFLGEIQAAKTQPSCSVDCSLPVAVLIGPSTGSSGEVTAISFTSRPNTRVFGERSVGYANSTQGFYVGGKRIYMLLATALIKNNKGKIFNHFIDPDVLYPSTIQLNKIEDDLVLKSLEWLKSLN